MAQTKATASRTFKITAQTLTVDDLRNFVESLAEAPGHAPINVSSIVPDFRDGYGGSRSDTLSVTYDTPV